MSVITACFGGIIRDLLGDTRSIIFSREIYVTAALMASLVFVCLHDAGCQREVAIVVAVATGFALRAAAIVWGWSLPHHRSQAGHDS